MWEGQERRGKRMEWGTESASVVRSVGGMSPPEPSSSVISRRSRRGAVAPEVREAYSRASQIVELLDKSVVAASAERPSPRTLQRNRKALALRVGDALKLGPVVFDVGPFGLSAYGRTIHNPGNRVGWVFKLFLDGVRGLVFDDNVTARALGELIDVLAGDPPHGDDRITWLWRKGLPGVQIQAVDVLLSDFEQSQDGELRLSEDFGQIRVKRSGPGSSNEIVMLPRDDMRVLRGSSRLAWIAEVTVPSTGAAEVRTLAHDVRQHAGGRTDWPRFMLHIMQAAGFGGPRAVCPSPLLGGLVDALVAEEKDDDLAALLRAFARYDNAESVRIRKLVFTRERLLSLAPAMERQPDELADPLAIMAKDLGEALADLIIAVKRQRAEERMFLIAQDVGDALAIPCYVRQLTSGDVQQALKAIPPLARSQDPAALAGLGRALDHRAPAMRRAGVRALAGRYHEALREPLVKLLRDRERANRVTALGILRDSKDPRVVLPILRLVQADDFAERPAEERKAFYRCLVVLGDVRGFGQLESQLNNRKVADDHLLIIQAFGRAGPKRARRILEEAKGKRALGRGVRKAAEEALVYWRTV